MSGGALRAFAEFDSTFRAVPLCCATGDFGKTDAVEVEPFSVTLLMEVSIEIQV